MRALSLILALLLLAFLLHEICGGLIGEAEAKKKKKKKLTKKKKKKKAKKQNGGGASSQCALYNGLPQDECDDLISHGCKVRWVGLCDVQFGGGCKSVSHRNRVPSLVATRRRCARELTNASPHRQLGNCPAYGCVGGCNSDPACTWVGGSGGSCQSALESSTKSPTMAPSKSPSVFPTHMPSNSPSRLPTQSPSTSSSTTSPSVSPTSKPTKSPTASPTRIPSQSPTTIPSHSPTRKPSASPTRSPTLSPTTIPSHSPTRKPSASPTRSPTQSPTTIPSHSPTTSPTAIPTKFPTLSPTTIPSHSPTTSPTASPTQSPTQLPTTSPSDSPTKSPTASARALFLALGGYFSVLEMSDSVVVGWGANDNGQLGLNYTNNSVTVPTPMSLIDGEVLQIAAGAYHSCAILTTGALQCWGLNSNGQLGLNNSNSFVKVPATVSLLGGNASQIALGGGHSCAVLTDGTVQCWGDESFGQLGLSHVGGKKTVPTTVSSFSGDVLQIALGQYHSCAVLTTRVAQCWGRNDNGQLGLNITNSTVSAPTTISSLIGEDVSQIALGGEHTCAVLTTGALRCWGDNSLGQLGLNYTGAGLRAPMTVTSIGGTVSQVALGNAHTCALLTTGAVQCWGDNAYGKLGLNSTASLVPVPTTVTLIGGEVSQIAVGGEHTCALLTTGAVQCWGDNDNGQLGLNSTNSPISFPTYVTGFH